MPKSQLLVEASAFELKPVTSAVRRVVLTRRRTVIATSILAGCLALGEGAVSAAERGIEEIIVTAQKREQNLQDVPISLQVLGQQQLEDLGINGFDDYVRFLPSVSHQSAGPGQSQIYMRGISDGGDGNFSGTSPSVAVYLDEQPVTSIGRNLDVHVYDIARIEAIAGPQGTLYGANSQAGTIRIVTNRPNTDELEAGFDLSANTQTDGDPGYSVDGYLNVPLSDRVALRLVGWYLEDGGWIDVVPGSKTFSRSGITITNSGNGDGNKNTVEEDYNELTNSGLRAALGIDLNDSWTATGSVMLQKQQSDGIFADQPDSLGEGKVLRFFQDNYEDEWSQLGLLLEGDLGFADLVFSGTYLDRDVEYDIDYTQYSEYSNYIEYYYTCVAYDFGNCTDPRIQYDQDSTYKRSTYELRLQSNGDSNLDWVVGAFYTENEHEYFNKWLIPTIPDGNDVPLNRNVDGVENLYFVTNQERTSSETAFFGELTYHFNDQFSATAGIRVFETEDELSGFVGSRFSCFDPADGNRVGNGTATSASCGGGLDIDDDDVTVKLNLSYSFNDDIMGYVTYSEGFRPGGINREGTDVIAQIYKPDFLKNFEVGMKTTLADGRVRLNGAVYVMDWDDLQLTRFDQDFNSFLGLTANTDGADVWGIEGDLTWAISELWTMNFAASYNDGETKKDFFVGTNDPDPAAPKGTELPFAPELKFTFNTRYQFNVGNSPSFVQASWTYTDSSYNDLFIDSRVRQDSYNILDLSAGSEFGKIGVDVFIANATDERAEIAHYSRAGDDRVTTNRPRTIGVRMHYRM